MNTEKPTRLGHIFGGRSTRCNLKGPRNATPKISTGRGNE
jgi:hypothetical protein